MILGEFRTPRKTWQCLTLCTIIRIRKFKLVTTAIVTHVSGQLSYRIKKIKSRITDNYRFLRFTYSYKYTNGCMCVSSLNLRCLLHWYWVYCVNNQVEHNLVMNGGIEKFTHLAALALGMLQTWNLDKNQVNTNIKSILLYDCGTWKITKLMRLKVFINRSLSHIFHLTVTSN